MQYSGDVYLTDFDLLARRSSLDDYIQLGQRFLPHLNWELDRLLAYHMINDAQLKAWLYTVCIPSDIVRGLLYAIQYNPSHTPSYLTQMGTNWI